MSTGNIFLGSQQTLPSDDVSEPRTVQVTLLELFGLFRYTAPSAVLPLASSYSSPDPYGEGTGRETHPAAAWQDDSSVYLVDVHLTCTGMHLAGVYLHAHEVHAREMHAREVYAHETHAHQMHAREMHAREVRFDFRK